MRRRSLNLITGYAGKAHITSAGDGAVNAAIYGGGRYVLNAGECFDYELLSNNQIRIKSGYAMIQGRKIELAVSDYEDIEIDNGLQGVKRCDLIVISYEKNVASGIETATIRVIKGTSGDDYVDPEHTSGDILSGAILDDFPLYRVKIDGLNVEAVEKLFEVRKDITEDDLKNNVSTFDSTDTSDVDAADWTSVEKLRSGETMKSILGKIAAMFKNIRYLHMAHDYDRDKNITEYYYSSLERAIIDPDDGTITEGIYQKSKGKSPYTTTKELLSALMQNMEAFYNYFIAYVNPQLSKKQNASTAINTSNIGEQSVMSAKSAESANTAEKLGTSAGSTTQPVYFKDGKPAAGKYTLADACARDVKTATAVTDSGYGTNNDKVPDLAFLAFWNGAFNNVGKSNLAYCKHGAFGTMATKGTGDYLPSTGGTLTGNVTVARTNANPAVAVQYGNDADVKKNNGGALYATNAGNFGIRDFTNSAYLLQRDSGADVYLAAVAPFGNVYIGRDATRTEIRGEASFTRDLYIGYHAIIGDESSDGGSGSNPVKLLCINTAGNIHMGDYGETNIAPVFLHAEGFQYNFYKASFRPNVTNRSSLGTAGLLWTTVYAKTGTINTSDRTKKHDINDLTDAYEQLFLKLQPKSFIFNDGDRVHIGAISQDVEEAMQELDIEPEQFAGFCKDIRYEYTEFNEEDGMPIEASKVPCRDEDGNVIYDYALRYQEFIFLTIHMVQKLYSRVETLEEENKKLWEKMEQLEDHLIALEK